MDLLSKDAFGRITEPAPRQNPVNDPRAPVKRSRVIEITKTIAQAPRHRGCHKLLSASSADIAAYRPTPVPLRRWPVHWFHLPESHSSNREGSTRVSHMSRKTTPMTNKVKDARMSNSQVACRTWVSLDRPSPCQEIPNSTNGTVRYRTVQ